MSRVRISESQFRLLFGKKPEPGKPGKRAPRTAREKALMPENQLERQCCDWLRVHGWTVTRQQSGAFRVAGDNDAPDRWVRIGELGTADWRMEKAIGTYQHAAPLHWLAYFELKAPGKKPRPSQLLWLDRRQATGTPARWFDSFDAFKAWCRKTWPGESWRG